MLSPSQAFFITSLISLVEWSERHRFEDEKRECTRLQTGMHARALQLSLFHGSQLYMDRGDSKRVDNSDNVFLTTFSVACVSS